MRTARFLVDAATAAAVYGAMTLIIATFDDAGAPAHPAVLAAAFALTVAAGAGVLTAVRATTPHAHRLVDDARHWLPQATRRLLRREDPWAHVPEHQHQLPAPHRPTKEQ